jgi:hypothetical protein
MNYEVTGRLIVKEDIQAISDRFKKREFVIEVENERNSDWNDFIKVQLTQDRCDLVENMNINDMIKVSFNLRGRKWENNGQTSYFTNLEGWRVEKAAQDGNNNPPVPTYAAADIPAAESEVDDLPF